ncbi:MAG: Crp/Fnr family transcriptional regulator [Bacteroidia bacterium]
MKVLEALQMVHAISKSSQELIAELIVEKSYKKGEHLLEIGQIDKQVHFIVKGSGRVYYLHKGLDVTDYIAMDGQFLGGVSSVFTGMQSHKAIELTEDSIIESVKQKDLEELSLKHHEIETLYRKLMTWAFLECQARIEDIRFMSAAERYHALEAKYPGVSNRIPLKFLASYLGTTQVSLSRIRAGKQ